MHLRLFVRRPDKTTIDIIRHPPQAVARWLLRKKSKMREQVPAAACPGSPLFIGAGDVISPRLFVVVELVNSKMADRKTPVSAAKVTRKLSVRGATTGSGSRESKDDKEAPSSSEKKSISKRLGDKPKKGDKHAVASQDDSAPKKKSVMVRELWYPYDALQQMYSAEDAEAAALDLTKHELEYGAMCATLCEHSKRLAQSKDVGLPLGA